MQIVMLLSINIVTMDFGCSCHMDHDAIRSWDDDDSPTADLSDMKCQLANTAQMLECTTQAEANSIMPIPLVCPRKKKDSGWSMSSCHLCMNELLTLKERLESRLVLLNHWLGCSKEHIPQDVR